MIKKDTKDIVKADKIIVHMEDNYYGTTSEDDVEKVINEMSRWNFDHFDNISNEVDHISTLTEKNDVVEIIYPGLISINLYKSILTIKDKNYPNFSFDQIVINTEESQKRMV